MDDDLTPGQRLYAIRLQYGDGVRKAESLKDFSKRIKKVTGEHYDPTTISLLERMEQSWRLDDANILCLLDKQKRGSAWITHGIAAAKAQVVPDPRKRNSEGQKGA